MGMVDISFWLGWLLCILTTSLLHHLSLSLQSLLVFKAEGMVVFMSLIFASCHHTVAVLLLLMVL